MRTPVDPGNALATHLARLRTEYSVPESFPPEVLAAAQAAAKLTPADHVDRTKRDFVTLDPASSTDLDQAFAVETSGADVILHYAIADVAWFVRDGDAIDTEAWRRGQTIYLPDGKAPLYPPILSQDAASLLPDGPRPAIVFSVRAAPDGTVRLDGAERALIRSRAKLAYDAVTPADLPPGFAEFARRVQAAEAARGAARVDPPEQEVAATPQGHFALTFRPRLQSETDNAALSLAANLAIADALQAHHTGLFRVMAGPSERAIHALRDAARALDLRWPDGMTLEQFQQSLDPADPAHAAFMLTIRRAGDGASYTPYREGVTPWHAAMAATYAHATAPLRRLADRYVVQATLAIANGRAVPDAVAAAFPRLPKVMARAEARAGQIERAVIDLAETVMLQDRVGQAFSAVVTDTDERGARIQLCDLPIIARTSAPGAAPGDRLHLRLATADPGSRALTFEQIAATVP